MTHTRYPRAAVATGNPDPRGRNPLPKTSPSAPSVPEVLWASHALAVPGGGRLVGVRRVSPTEVEVGRVEPWYDRIHWVVAESVLTERAARLWLARARFSRK